MSTATDWETWIRHQLFDRLRSNAALTGLLNYDPATETGRDAKIYDIDPPDDRRHPIAVQLAVQSDSGGPNNAADERSWSVEVRVEATEDWYESHYGRNTRQEITTELLNTLTRPGIPGLVSRGHTGFRGTEPQVATDVSRQWTAEFHYELRDVHPYS